MDIKTLWSRYRNQSMLMKIIIVNALVFIVLRVVDIVAFFLGVADPSTLATRWVELPSDMWLLLRRPWTIITYMFAQFDVLHFVFNMLWLYWFGQVFMLLSTPRRLMGLYLLGGFGGALFYLLSYNLFPYLAGIHGMLIGASASVIAIVTATALMSPDYKMYMFFIGAVSLKWVAIVTIGIDLISITGSNAGGHLAHLGGAVVGAVFALQLRRGHDITAPFGRMLDAIVNFFRGVHYGRPCRYRWPKDASRYSSPAASNKKGLDVDDRRQLDAILDKIKKSGYTSLTADERRRLFDVSSKIK